MAWNKPLDAFPRPNVAVDLALLTATPSTHSKVLGELSVLVIDAPAGRRRALPGQFMRERCTIEQTIAEILWRKLGVAPGTFTPTLLEVFDKPSRDSRGTWTLSLAHAVSLPAEVAAGCRATAVPVAPDGTLATGEHLAFDHDAIVATAAAAIRARYRESPDPDSLLDAPFTLAELRRLHEAVLGTSIQKDSFNRLMRPQLEGLTDKEGEPITRVSTVGRPAQLFREPR